MNLWTVFGKTPAPAAAVLLLFATGCAPKLYTSIQHSYPARAEGSPVLVYEPGDVLPGETKFIGSIKISDTGFSVGCSYPKVIGVAKAETNKAGGNCLYLIQHFFPNLASSCHQIAGRILLLPDSLFHACYYDNLQVQRGRTLIYASGEKSAPEELARQTAESYMAQHGISSPQRNAVPKKPSVSAQKPVQQPAPQPTQKPARPSPKSGYSTLVLDAGYAFITSKYKLAEEHVEGNPKQGVDIGLSYQWVSNSGMGFGVRYSGYFTSATLRLLLDDGKSYSTAKDLIRLHYFAPEVVLRMQIGRKWFFNESVGIGYAHYTEEMNGHSVGIGGIGFHATAGVEYKLAKNVGLGFSLTAYFSRFWSMDRFVQDYTDHRKKAGISRLSLDGGLRFYF